MTIYERLVRPILFGMDPEKAHGRAVCALRCAGGSWPGRALLRGLYSFDDPSLETVVAGVRFPNPVGLAAGFDKDCRLAGVLPSLGFGFIEVGTITPLPQPGNPQPRIFRIPESRALINRLGFNNDGTRAAAERLRKLSHRKVPIGVNIGKGRDTSPERAVEDYLEGFKALSVLSDYIVVNVSSPNTKGLRDLQEQQRLERILSALQEANAAKRPIFVKLAPDLSPEQLDSLCPLLLQCTQGAVISNTTLSRDGLPADFASMEGGMSGAPLKSLSTRMIARVWRQTQGRLPIIGVGGIFTAQDAFEKIRAGASLVQIYTGFIYKGPDIVREIGRGLARILREQGLKSISEAVGLDHRPSAARTA